MKLRSRFWLEQDEVRVFGKGPCELLEAVDRFGTLTKATDKLNMSYSKAWSIIKRAEKKLGFLLLESKAGGADGGGSNLTFEAKKLIKSYHGFCFEANQILEELYDKYFNYLN